MGVVTRGPGHCQVAIPNRKGSYGLLSLSDDVDTAVVFVHGFLGDATSTWEHFPYLIDSCASEHPWWNAVDAFFYDYKGTLHTPIVVHAEEFLTFLKEVYPSPPDTLFRPSYAPQERLRPEGFKYRKLLLVGHSEGSVVIRRFLVAYYKLVRDTLPQIPFVGLHDYAKVLEDLEAKKRQFLETNPALCATVILFAPVHLGATLTGWLGILLRCLESKRLLGSFISCLTGYDELKKGSPALAQLQRDTESFAKESKYCKALAAQCYFGDKDRIVCISEYTTDPKCEVIKNHGHWSICKPHVKYKEPLSYVTDEQGRGRSAP